MADGVHLSQSKYAERLLKEEYLAHCESLNTLLPLNTDESSKRDDDCALSVLDCKWYWHLIGGLPYLAICSSSFYTSMVARRLYALTKPHLVFVKQVARYISGTTNNIILYPNSSICSSPLVAFADADWAACKNAGRSTTGILVKVNSDPVFWTSKRQSIITLSSADAGYVALYACAKPIVWLRRLFLELVGNKPNFLRPKKISYWHIHWKSYRNFFD